MTASLYAKRPRFWYEHSTWQERALALRKSIGMPIAKKSPEWVCLIAQYVVTSTWYPLARQLRGAAKILAEDADARAAFDSLERLGQSRRLVLAWLISLVAPKDPPPTPEEKARALADARAARVAAAEQHARTKLAAAEKRVALAERVRERWAKKVRYYDRKGDRR